MVAEYKVPMVLDQATISTLLQARFATRKEVSTPSKGVGEGLCPLPEFPGKALKARAATFATLRIMRTLLAAQLVTCEADVTSPSRLSLGFLARWKLGCVTGRTGERRVQVRFVAQQKHPLSDNDEHGWSN